jgi:hypothetical protein
MHVLQDNNTLEPKWEPKYADKLYTACEATLQAGVDPDKAFPVVLKAALDDVNTLPWNLEKLFIEFGLGPDVYVCGESLLHRLLQNPRPPPIRGLDLCTAEIRANSSGTAAAKDAATDAAKSEPLATTLDELLARKATPDLQDVSGNTALHLLVACMVQRISFPDTSAMEMEEASASGQPEVSGEDHDAERAQYALAAFHMLLEAGWTTDAANKREHTPMDLISEGVRRYKDELEDLINPTGRQQLCLMTLADRVHDDCLHKYAMAVGKRILLIQTRIWGSTGLQKRQYSRHLEV